MDTCQKPMAILQAYILEAVRRVLFMINIRGFTMQKIHLTVDKFVTNLFISKLVFTKSEGQVTF